MVGSFNNHQGLLKLFLVLVAFSGWCSPISGNKVHVVVRNDIGNNILLNLQCRNTQAYTSELGSYKLGYKQLVEWRFEAHTHRIWCYASWHYNFYLMEGGFYVYRGLEDVDKCYENCIQDAKLDGVWGYTNNGRPYMKYKWYRSPNALGEEIKV